MRFVRDTRDAVRAIQQDDVSRGDKLRPWRFQGYEGHATKSIRYGERGGLLIWESSGETTPFTLDRMKPSHGYALRLDLQLTLSFSSPQRGFGASCLKSSTPTQTHLRSSSKLVGQSSRTDGLCLLTVGRRSDRSYWRLYDKGVESKTAAAGRKWRLELETKSTLAAELCDNHSTVLTDPRSCATYCVSSWKSQGLSWPTDVFGEGCELASAPKRMPAGAGQLAIWLTHTVKPTIPRLLTVFTVAEVLEMLGLDEKARPIRRNDADRQ